MLSLTIKCPIIQSMPKIEKLTINKPGRVSVIFVYDCSLSAIV